MRTPREAATSRAQGVTMAPGAAEISPPGGTAITSWAVTTSFKRAMIANMNRARGRRVPARPRAVSASCAYRPADAARAETLKEPPAVLRLNPKQVVQAKGRCIQPDSEDGVRHEALHPGLHRIGRS